MFITENDEGGNGMNVRYFLERATMLEKKIKQKKKELALTEEMAMTISSPGLGGIPSATKNTTPAFVRYTDKKMELEGEIERLNNEITCVRLDIESTINTLSDIRCKRILVYRHLFGMKWKEIANKIGYTERWTINLYNKAVSELEQKNSY